MLALNINQESKRVIFDRFNAINSLQLNPDDFTLDPAENHVDTIRKTNARVLVKPLVVGDGYNNFYIYYNKMALSDVFDRVNAKVETSGLGNLLEIIDLVNDEFGIYLTFEDIEDSEIVYDDPMDRQRRGVVTIETKDDSFLFSGTHVLVVNERINPYDSVAKSAVTGIALSTTSVVNVNTSLSEESYFNFLDGVTINTAPVIRGFKLIDDAVYVFGDFDIDVPTTISGNQGSGIYKAVTVNRIGRVLSVDKVAKFDDVHQADVCFAAKPDNSKFYLADKKLYNTTSVNLVGLYRFNAVGDRDNTLVTSAISSVVNKVLPLESGFITASIQLQTPIKVVKINRYTETGAIDGTFSPIDIGNHTGIDFEVQGIVPAKNSSGVVVGFYVMFRDVFTQDLVPTVNGSRVYGDNFLEKNNYTLPVLKFTLGGVLDTSFNGNYSKVGKEFFRPEIGVTNYEKIFPLDDGFIIFNRVLNPITRLFTLVGLRVKGTGQLTFITGEDYYNLPIVKSISSIRQNDQTFLASVIVEEKNNFGQLVEVSKVIGFDADGKYLGSYLELESPALFKDMAIFKN